MQPRRSSINLVRSTWSVALRSITWNAGSMGSMVLATCFAAMSAQVVLCQSDRSTAFELENLRGRDTLVVHGCFADCGEWGGHCEWLRFYRTEVGRLRYHYLRDTVNCPNTEGSYGRIIEDRVGEVQPSNEYHISLFLQDLLTASFHGGISHASDGYGARRTSTLHSFEVVFADAMNDWPAFLRLRKVILDGAE